MGQHVLCFTEHRLGVIAKIEGMRRAIEELDVLRVDCPDDIERRLQGFAPILGMRFEVQVYAFLFKDRHQFFHRAPPGVFA